MGFEKKYSREESEIFDLFRSLVIVSVHDFVPANGLVVTPLGTIDRIRIVEEKNGRDSPGPPDSQCPSMIGRMTYLFQG